MPVTARMKGTFNPTANPKSKRTAQIKHNDATDPAEIFIPLIMLICKFIRNPRFYPPILLHVPAMNSN